MEKKEFPKYISPYKQLRLVIESSYPKTPFHPGSTGRAVQFNNGTFVAKSDDEVEFLDSHPESGIKFFKEQKQEVSGISLPEELIDVLKDYSASEAKELLKKIKEGAQEKTPAQVRSESEYGQTEPTHQAVASSSKPKKTKAKTRKVIE